MDEATNSAKSDYIRMQLGVNAKRLEEASWGDVFIIAEKRMHQLQEEILAHKDEKKDHHKKSGKTEKAKPKKKTTGKTVTAPAEAVASLTEEPKASSMAN